MRRADGEYCSEEFWRVVDIGRVVVGGTFIHEGLLGSSTTTQTFPKSLKWGSRALANASSFFSPAKIVLLNSQSTLSTP